MRQDSHASGARNLVNVLLIEDCPDDAFLVTDSLRHTNIPVDFQVTAVESLAQARGRIGGGAFDVVVCDLGLPDGQGMQTVEAARQLAEKLPLVLLTGREDLALAMQAMHSGAEDYIVKESTGLESLGRVLMQATARHQLREQLAAAHEREGFLATHDLLTGLPNRHLFLEHLSQAMAAAHRRGSLLALLFLDLDRFKTVNDVLGHTVGDQYLKRVAERLRQCVREGDTVARLGGDEFVVLLEDAQDPAHVTMVAGHIREAIAKPLLLEGRTLESTVSIGISVFPTHGHDADRLIRSADRAMYHAKYGGQGVVVYSPDLERVAAPGAHLRDELREAMDGNQFCLYYQPQMNVRTGAIVGAEALVRWQHPQMGQIGPARLLPLIAEMGRMEELGRWVLRTACAEAARWQPAGIGPVSIAVNLSPEQVCDRHLPGLVTDVLSETGLDPAALVLEIPETGFYESLEATIPVLKATKRLGVRVAVDDFGTGNSSFVWLKYLPVDILKLDQCFVRGLPWNRVDIAIVESLMLLAENLGLEVVAEGVELERELELLKELRCETVQGYLLGMPMPGQQLFELLRQGHKACTGVAA